MKSFFFFFFFFEGERVISSGALCVLRAEFCVVVVVCARVDLICTTQTGTVQKRGTSQNPKLYIV